MGIDIYARWKGQTDEEEKKQFTGFSTVAGKVGYLREAYHGDPYATKFLVAESFVNGKKKIPAKVLRERLPKTLEIVKEREEKLYKASEDQIKEVQKSFKDFVKLCEKKEKETGEAVTILASY